MLAYLSDAGGPHLDIDRADWNHSRLPELPQYIPVLEKSVKRLHPLPRRQAYGIPLAKAINVRESFELPPTLAGGNVHDKLGVCRDTAVVLFMAWKDAVLHRVWRDGEVEELWSGVSDQGYSAIVAPNFSVWTDAPRLEHLVEMKRTLVITDMIRRTGLPAIPHLYFTLDRPQDRQRWASWLRRNPDISTISVNLQLLLKRSGTRERAQHYEAIVTQLRMLASEVDRPLTAIVQGPVQPADIRPLGTTGLRIVVANGRAYHSATSRRELYLNDGTVTWRQLDTEDKSGVFEHNVALMEDVVSAALSRSATS